MPRACVDGLMECVFEPEPSGQRSFVGTTFGTCFCVVCGLQNGFVAATWRPIWARGVGAKYPDFVGLGQLAR